MRDGRRSGRRARTTLLAASALTAAAVAAGALLPDGGDGARTGAAASNLKASAPGARDRVRRAGEARQPSSGERKRDGDAAAAKRTPNTIGFWSKRRGLIGFGDTHSRNGGRVMRTTDGGRSFEVVHRTESGVAWIETAGKQDAWVVTQGPGGRHRLLHTGDRGRTWQSISADPPFAPSFSTPNDGMAMKVTDWDPERNYGGVLESKRVLITRDGGESWSPVKSPCSTRRIGGSVVTGAGVAMATQTDALAVCVGEGYVGLEPKAIYRTKDAGRTWQKVTDDESCDGSTGICRLGSAHGITLDASGAGTLRVSNSHAYLTWDFGQSWSHRRTGRWFGYVSTLAAEPVSGRAVVALVFGGRSEYRLIVTADRGEHWRVVHKWLRSGNG